MNPQGTPILEQIIRLSRFPARALLVALSALCLTAPFAAPSIVVAVIIGALAGTLIGEVAHALKLRAPWVLGGAAASGLAVGLLSWGLTAFALPGLLIGPASALWASLVVAWLGTAASLTAGLRFLAMRSPVWRTIEAAGLAGSVTLAFASHRDGAFARPLWLTDIAWSVGLEAAWFLAALGALYALTFLWLFLVEQERRVPVLSAVLLPLLVALGLVFTDFAQMWIAPPPPEGLAGQGDPAGDGSDGLPPSGQGQGSEGDGSRDDGSGESSEGSGEGSDGTEEGSGDPSDGSSGGSDGGSGGGAPPPGDPPDGAGGGSAGGGGGSGGKSPKGGGKPDAPRPVAIVLLGDDYTPPDGYYYFRQEVLSEFSTTQLVRSGVDGDWLDHFPVQRETVRQPPGELLRTPVQGVVALLVPHGAPFGLEAPAAYEPRVNPNAARFVRSYRFFSQALTQRDEQLSVRAAGDPTWTPEQREHYTANPDDPRYTALVETILGDLPDAVRQDPFTRATRLQIWLGENMKYTKKVKILGKGDPVGDFLFGDRIGYCVHSAHALAFMLREAGLPARVGTGYAVTEDQRQGSAILVTDKDAHAWPEVYLEGVGWLIMDVAPAENLDPEGQPPDLDVLDQLADWARDEPVAEPFRRPDLTPIAKALAILTASTGISLVAAVLMGLYLRKAWRRLRPLVASKRALPRVGYRSALDILADAGLIRDEGESREGFARRIAAVSPSFEALTWAHLDHALGPKRDPEAMPGRNRWQAHLANLRRDLVNHRPLWRRLIGALDPTTPFRSR